MFDVAPTELLLCAVIALVVIGPKDLPKAMRFVGHWIGKARGMAKHFRSGIDTMMRESELDEMEKKWREHNEAIMRAYPTIDGSLNPTPGAAQIVDNIVVPGPPMPASASAPAHVEPFDRPQAGAQDKLPLLGGSRDTVETATDTPAATRTAGEAS